MKRSRGQSLVEFAFVFPLFMFLVGAVIQGGVLFWGTNSLNQIVRDAGRWAATQTCDIPAEVTAEVNAIALEGSLIGFDGTLDTVTVTWPPTDGADPDTAPDPCPPTSNVHDRWVTIEASHTVPVFFPIIPGGGVISSSATFRMEPAVP